MADGITYKLQGIDSVLGRLDSLSQDVKYKGGRAALRKAAELIRREAVANALRVNDFSTREEIAKNIAVRWSSRRHKSTGDLVFRVGVLGGARASSKAAEYSRRARRRKGVASLESLGELAGQGKNNPGGDTFYWRYIEFGTSKVAARPFMRPALSENVAAATNEFSKHFEPAIDRAIKRAVKKQ